MNQSKYKDIYTYMISIKRETVRQHLFSKVYDIVKRGELESLRTFFEEDIVSQKFIDITLKRVAKYGVENAYSMSNRIVSIILSNIHKIIPKNIEEYGKLSQYRQNLVRGYLGIESDAIDDIDAYLQAYTVRDYQRLQYLLKTKETRYNPHQVRVRDFFLQYKPRYGILYHEMGSGKTCTATALISAISTIDDVTTVYVLVPNAYLVRQFADDFEYTCSFIYGQVWTRKEESSTIIFSYKHQTYYIMTYNRYSNLKDIQPNSVMIIDEAHNLRSATDITKLEGEHSEVQLHQSIFSKIITNTMTFKHVFYMTGTPVMNIPHDFIQLLNAMLVLTCQSNTMLTRLNNEEYKQLTKDAKPSSFFDQIPVLMKLIDHTLRTTRGFVSRVRVQDLASTLKLPEIDFSNHYYDYSSDFTGSIHGYEIPYDVYEKYKAGTKASPIKVPMSVEHYTSLMSIRTTRSTTTTPSSSSSISWDTKDKHIHTARVLCNKDKLQYILTNIQAHLDSAERSPILVHTTLMETVIDMETILKRAGFVMYDQDNESDAPTYAIISGKTPDVKVVDIMMAYNNVANIKGNIISVCIITSAAGTGFTFRNTRQMHIIEPYFNFSYLQQVTGRAVRHNVFNEYISDVDNQKYPPRVKVFAYIATKPRLFNTNVQQYQTIDEEILSMMYDKMKYVETYSSLLYKLSLEYPRSESNARDFYAYPPATETFTCTKEIKLLKSVKKIKENDSNETKTKKKDVRTKKSLFFSPAQRIKPMVSPPPQAPVNTDTQPTKKTQRKKKVIEKSDRVLRPRKIMSP